MCVGMCWYVVCVLLLSFGKHKNSIRVYLQVVYFQKESQQHQICILGRTATSSWDQYIIQSKNHT